jgi:LPXTG-site transpeptidase (sortase) family protein
MAIDPAGLTFEKVLTLRVVDNAPLLPATGFAPARVTQLGVQTVAYQDENEVYLTIPRLDLSIAVVGVPYQENGWNTDWLNNQAGWLNGTAFPGWPGNAVLAAHNYLADGSAGPFKALDQLRWGDKIEITAFNETSIYEVREVKKVKPDDLSVLSHQENAWLTLVTCKSFNEKTESYRWRIVVEAVLVEVK